MNLTIADSIVILGVLGTIITALITVVPSLIRKPPSSSTCSTCVEHSGVIKTQEALTNTLDRLQDTMDRFNETLITILTERKSHESGTTGGAA